MISNTQDLLLQRKAILNVFFDDKILDFEVKMDNHDELPLPFTYCKDLPGLIQFCQMRWGLNHTVNRNRNRTERNQRNTLLYDEV